MKYFAQTKNLMVASFFLLLVSCEKETDEPAPGNGTGTGTGTGIVTPPPNGKIASFTRIPIPTTDAAKNIIAVMPFFYVTNKGPYVEVMNGSNINQPKYSVHKYQGGSGALAWTSFVPDFATTGVINYRPVSMFNEKGNEFGIYWCNMSKYGMYNVNTGTPSFEFTVPGGANGPGVISEIIPITASSYTGGHWFLTLNEIWQESNVVVPKKFTKLIDLPGGIMSRLSGDGVLADPDEPTRLWVAAGDRLYQVSSVGNPTPPYAKIEATWNFNGGTNRISTILKVGGDIVVQLGADVYKKSGTSFAKIGTITKGDYLNNICTNGSQIFSSDGRSYDPLTGTWKSFIKQGTDLSAADNLKYTELQQYFSMGLPIGCLYGTSGPIYLLAGTELIQINPL